MNQTQTPLAPTIRAIAAQLPDSPAVASSYRFLRQYGNTIGCSVPLMLADPRPWPEGEALMVAFGLSFSCGAGVMTVPQGGWTP